MKCEQAEELLGAYALDALPDSEMADMRAHLSSCAEHATKAGELRAVALSLGSTVDEMRPPAALRDRIASAIATDAAAPDSRSKPAAPIALSDRRERTERRRWFAAPPPPMWGAIAAVLVAAVIGLGAWNLSLRSDSGAAANVIAVRPLMQDTGATAGFAVMFDDGTMAVRGDALPRLDASQTYQLWALTDEGEALSLGLLEYDEIGIPAANVSFDPAGASAVAITIEPAGGSEQPTSAPLYTAEA